MHAEFVAQRAQLREIRRVVHRHAGRALHERLDDDGREARRALLEQRAHRGDGRIDARHGRRRDHVRVADQRVVGVLEEGDIGHAERTDRFAVVAVREAGEFAFLVLSAIAPEVKAHLQRDFDRRRAIRREKCMTERALRKRRKTLGQFDGWGVRAAREHRVFERVELILQRAVDIVVRVAEEIDPPRTDRIEIAVALRIVEPRALAARDRHERHALVMFHLGARMPHGRERAGNPVLIGFCVQKRLPSAWTLALLGKNCTSQLSLKDAQASVFGRFFGHACARNGNAKTRYRT
jgi:hypothetical protein